MIVMQKDRIVVSISIPANKIEEFKNADFVEAEKLCKEIIDKKVNFNLNNKEKSVEEKKSKKKK